MGSLRVKQVQLDGNDWFRELHSSKKIYYGALSPDLEKWYWDFKDTRGLHLEFVSIACFP